jgi:tetratricopeptide (TPR) repeat protein
MRRMEPRPAAGLAERRAPAAGRGRRLRRLAHAVALAVALGAGALVAHATLEVAPSVAGGVVLLGWLAGARLVVPRLAHAAFRRRRARAARRWYRVLAAVSPAGRDAARVSLAGSFLLEGAWDHALRGLRAIDAAGLSAGLRAAWLNNVAYALVRGGAGSPGESLALCDEALALRAGVPGILHTRGLALLQDGRLEEAIRAFEDAWQAGDSDLDFEAERCHDLSVAWARQGHADYAADYRVRAVAAAPTSRWAVSAQAEPEAARRLGELESQLVG